MTDDYDAVVYDLDGTLVRLAVDWAAAAEPIKPILREHGADADADDALDLLPVAESMGLAEEVEPHLAAAERAGARDSERLPLLDELAAADGPVGICSLNCEAACRLALDAHGVPNATDVIVGRDSVPERKPHPQPLLTAMQKLGATPERTLFVGDSDSDAETARRAGTAFRRV
ncbi:HAD family hydrolase [Haladaptatus paucihalophilus]|uniref:Phosphoglycolate phosphatase n=1 Tax=Haladaptatus paucihalophilus DX253 TaxID=797209 RepID=A0A1M6P8V3_HALPU|nr:HAD family hydrolase [Haladaptatus paucihalophilus]SHK04368.1 phosphoglycolate phosphatase [Haladaptatus paucihalophilus DX253]